MLIDQLHHSAKLSIFKILLVKSTKECIFSVNSHLKKQIDGSPMGSPVSVVFLDTFCLKRMQ